MPSLLGDSRRTSALASRRRIRAVGYDLGDCITEPLPNLVQRFCSSPILCGIMQQSANRLIFRTAIFHYEAGVDNQMRDIRYRCSFALLGAMKLVSVSKCLVISVGQHQQSSQF